ncbi:TIGR03086 family metal-binding protein [Saccharopolyspora sp. NFXS83]|uniref:TIGR03086 family metal-binding protein n=1 Tax=Saccharopolyspora sp. NFXS83 TaxID=2993560 RepID=UPI00224A8FEA|nr:TIGR03086 family metal-binding protein [Saccharopolyspora sp. NFXS83]MCX2732132.1 TIGR03086 family metal-binding protein [Saccharopolyspora sp. NFXS83]
MEGNPAPRVLGGVDLLERAVNYLTGVLHDVPATALSRPTPCAAWDLRALLAHLDDSVSVLDEAVGGRIGLGPEAPSEADPTRALRDRSRRLLGAWNAAVDVAPVTVFGAPVSRGVVVGTGALEIAVHGWDIARSSGQHRPLPTALADDLLPLVPLLVADADRPGRFDAPIPLPAGAGAPERLLGFLGRDPR